MRVIAGKFRSRPLRSLRGAPLRPTSDRLRETLFNVIAAAAPIEGTVWLDLFAGTGAVGIEAISRGARQVFFVEESAQAARLIRQNLALLEIESGFEVLDRPANAALRKLDAQGIQCDICFLDPPYNLHQAYKDCLEFLSQSRILLPQSMVIVEHSQHFDPGEGHATLRRYRKLEQGDGVLSFYKRG
jgi:16S rRNA (guanine(966)-N(2))-methyltransferase RsmD